MASRFSAYSAAVTPSMPGAPSLRVSRKASFIHSRSMTWCSVDNAAPRFDLASSAIRCRFVDRFVRLKVLSRVSRRRFSPRDAPLPSIGSRRVRFPNVTSTMRALRLPIHASPVAYLFRFRSPRDSSLLRVRCCQRSRANRGHCLGPGSLFNRRPHLPVRVRVDVSGISQVPRRPILCLCPGPRPRPNRRSLANDGTVGAALAPITTKASALLISGLPRGFSTCCLRFKNGVATAPARLASGWLAGLYRMGVEPIGSQ